MIRAEAEEEDGEWRVAKIGLAPADEEISGTEVRADERPPTPDDPRPPGPHIPGQF
jgi:hypothetical protein